MFLWLIFHNAENLTEVLAGQVSSVRLKSFKDSGRPRSCSEMYCALLTHDDRSDVHKERGKNDEELQAIRLHVSPRGPPGIVAIQLENAENDYPPD